MAGVSCAEQLCFRQLVIADRRLAKTFFVPSILPSQTPLDVCPRFVVPVVDRFDGSFEWLPDVLKVSLACISQSLSHESCYFSGDISNPPSGTRDFSPECLRHRAQDFPKVLDEELDADDDCAKRNQ